MMIHKTTIQRAFNKAAAHYETLALFQKQLNERMQSLLPNMLPSKFYPSRILDAGCGTGLGTQYLKTHWSQANVIGCDISLNMANEMRHKQLEVITADIEHLPFKNHCFNLIWSSLCLQWCHPTHAFKELFRVLSTDGILFFSTLAPGTLKEIHNAFSGLDKASHTLTFISKTALEALLSNMGFKKIELIQETHQIFYPDIHAVMKSIKGIGAGNVENRRTTLLGKQAWKMIQERYERFREVSGLPVTYEVIIGAMACKS